ncbi:hypothetical protein J2S70_000399 [Trueperella bonasi]|uniref:Integral membrane protein n=1 Tax=Trueperella bonasi TaxID=312286 RepID=A0ABT9NEK6_9ACTO|nr:DUF6350 family protein [Trueperella bonasi]MDP9805817.1 hypothetical protein [Trueperella bonasi]
MKTIDFSREIVAARGALAAPFFTWLAMVMFTVVLYTLTASAPMLGDTTWTDAARLGTGWWMTAYGGELSIGGTPVSLMPLTVTFIAIYASYVAFRKRQVSTWGEVASAGFAQAGTVAVIGLLMQPSGAWWPAIFGAFVIGATTATAAARHELLKWEWAYESWDRIRLLLRALAIASVVVGVLAVILGWSRILEIHGSYLTGMIGSVGLVLFQLAYVPVGIVWALAWFLGAGFAVGEGTAFSVLGVEAAPLPAIPVFGALPEVSQGRPWVLIIIAVVFTVLGVIVTRRENIVFKQTLIRTAISVSTIAMIASLLGLMASGAIGPGRMQVTGPTPAVLFGFTLLIVGLPFLLGSVVAHEETIERVRSRIDEFKEDREPAEASPGQDVDDSQEHS